MVDEDLANPGRDGVDKKVGRREVSDQRGAMREDETDEEVEDRRDGRRLCERCGRPLVGLCRVEEEEDDRGRRARHHKNPGAHLIQKVLRIRALVAHNAKPAPSRKGGRLEGPVSLPGRQTNHVFHGPADRERDNPVAGLGTLSRHLSGRRVLPLPRPPLGPGGDVKRARFVQMQAPVAFLPPLGPRALPFSLPTRVASTVFHLPLFPSQTPELSLPETNVWHCVPLAHC